MNHITVLKKEAVEMLQLQPHSVVVDATYGGGGHAQEICSHLDSSGLYIGIDADQSAFKDSFLESSQTGLRFHLVHDNFAHIESIVCSLHIAEVDGILADLGWRTDQFESGGKGFSFSSEDPLLMTYGDSDAYLFSAHDIVNGWKEEDIANVLFGYAEERYSRRIAQAIVRERATKSIETALELASIVESAVPAAYRKGRTHAATKTFQALRIAVNDELKTLETFLIDAAKLLALYGNLAVISFHSLEDRQVKLMFRELASTGEYALVNKKPVVASAEELAKNPRARSAKLRVIQRIA
jgi:16S rRNA (cytosine1402-N4)-methyltransferase